MLRMLSTALGIGSMALAGVTVCQGAGGYGPGPGGGGGGMGGGGGGGGGGMGSGGTLPTFSTSLFAGSGDCAMCHSQLTDTTGADVSIDTHWRSTMMANAARDPLWQAKIESEVLRSPALSGVIQEKCSRCHMPMARTQAGADGTAPVILGGFLEPSHYLHTPAMDGVSCSLCHQVQPQGLGTPETFTGKYGIDLVTAKPNRLAFGQYPNPFGNPMIMHVGYVPVQSQHIRDSGHCGACHTLYTPVVDGQGNVLDYEFPEQMTYLEWAHSAVGGGIASQAACRDCHVPPAAGAAAISNRPWHLSPRSPFGLHYFVGGNAFMLKLLKANAADLGLTADATQLDATLARTTVQLQTQTAGLAIRNATLANGVLTAVVEVNNVAAHKLPSGVPLRRAWLHLKVTDRKGRLLFESGAPQADGSIQGNDADLFGNAFEPHYDLIDRADQVQIYESVMHNTDFQLTYTFLRAAGYLKDNRLLPTGFDKATAGPDIAVYGNALADPNFVAGSDLVTYRVALPGVNGRLYVTAELLYQSVGASFAKDLTLGDSPLVNRFALQYAAADKAPTVVGWAQRQVP